MPTAREYTEARLPWFEYYDGDRTALEGAKKLAGLDSVAAKRLKKGKDSSRTTTPCNRRLSPRCAAPGYERASSSGLAKPRGTRFH